MKLFIILIQLKVLLLTQIGCSLLKKQKVKDLDPKHDENETKWRCVFRCGKKKVSTFLGSEVNICQDVGYQFYLKIEKNEKEGEEKAVKQCSDSFDDITSSLYIQAKYFCNFTKCNPPIAKEVLPPLDFRVIEDKTEETKERMKIENTKTLLQQDPLILQRIGEIDKRRLEKVWSRSEVKLTEDNLLIELDKRIIQLKLDICSDNQKVRSAADLQLSKLSFFAEEVDQQNDMVKAMVSGLVAFTNFNPNLLQPFVKAIGDTSILTLNQQLKKIVVFLRTIKNTCLLQKRFKFTHHTHNLTQITNIDYSHLQSHVDLHIKEKEDQDEYQKQLQQSN